jgi:hypothetical protein
LPWLILKTVGSAQELGTMLAVFGIPRALSMPEGGWLSDRLRRMMLIADVARFCPYTIEWADVIVALGASVASGARAVVVEKSLSLAKNSVSL